MKNIVSIFAILTFGMLAAISAQGFTLNTAANWRRTEPEPFAITSPGSVVNKTPTVQWTAAFAAVNYQVDVGTGAGCTGTIQTYTGLTSLTKRLSALNSGTYFICVSAVSATGQRQYASNSGLQVTVPAPFELGQTSLTTSSYANSFGPGSLSTDGTRLFAVDQDRNRILIWNSIPTAINTPPDLVLGQPDLFNGTPNNGGLSAHSLRFPKQIFSDGTRLFVADSGNTRVLIWNTIPTTNGKDADVVLGASNFTTTGWFHPSLRSIHFDGTRLFVYGTNYLTMGMWNTLPAVNGTNPNLEFSPYRAAPASLGFNGVYKIWSTGTRLFAAEASFNRILVWNSIPTAPVAPPDIVLGQPDAQSNTANNGGVSAHGLSSPVDLAVIGSKLYVLDSGNNRILVWDSLPTSFQQDADHYIGQTSFAGNDWGGGCNPGALWGMNSLTSDGTKLYAASAYCGYIHAWNSVPTASGPTMPDFILGRPAFSPPANVGLGVLRFPSGVSGDGTHLFASEIVTGFGTSRNLIWSTAPTTSNINADFDLRYYTNGPASGVVANSKFLLPENSRVLIYNSVPTAGNAAAAVVVGDTTIRNDPGPTNCGLGTVTTANCLSGANFITATPGKIIVGDSGNSRVLIYNSVPTSNYAAADVVVGQTSMTTTAAQAATSNPQGFNPYIGGCPLFVSCQPGRLGVATDGSHLVVCDQGNNRVLIWNSIPTSNGQAADIVLGQPSFSTNASGTSATTLSAPSNAYINGTRLYVTDSLNHRVLVWDTIPTTTQQPADYVIGQPNFTSAEINHGSSIGGDTLFFPTAVYAEGALVYVADTYNNRILAVPAP